MLANKMVVVVAAEAPVGVALNTAALLGVALGHHHDDVVGPSVTDASGAVHTGMCAHPIPVLRAPADRLRELRDAAASRGGVTVHDMNQVAQQSRTYEQFAATIGGTKAEDLEYFGLGIYGPRAAVDSLTGALALYR
ncbi:conserved hypothetical protein [Kribbella flavida DSM 17836]|uniref:DUF2000 domain-containing protein n=1 Tax=Kribbella flavida (strain DSM 17836 / JCM 10339 / NBRC 14399) TaxID=479435 RepID=D2PTS0_KRIFD|nr:DUF2000 domain-containing protein [Kribbella flavida]ADB31383.1 conserved hypothetical protein [Kribbella flavida DSM 17836]